MLMESADMDSLGSTRRILFALSFTILYTFFGPGISRGIAPCVAILAPMSILILEATEGRTPRKDRYNGRHLNSALSLANRFPGTPPRFRSFHAVQGSGPAPFARAGHA